VQRTHKPLAEQRKSAAVLALPLDGLLLCWPQASRAIRYTSRRRNHPLAVKENAYTSTVRNVQYPDMCNTLSIVPPSSRHP
jgi:hypothetical protein